LARRDLRWTADVLDGELVIHQRTPGTPEDGAWNGGSLDTRTLEGGELFFAFSGEETDGHEHVAGAFEGGAAAAVVSRRLDVSGPQIVVDDTYEALHELTRAVRRELPDRVLAITGSMGKTTTKELAAAIFATEFKAARNPGNFNNLYGFPISLLSVPEGTEVMVAEMGMSTPGELGAVSRLGKPDAVIVTAVKAVHLENFRSVSDIAEAKAEIFEGLSEDGLIVANRDDPEVTRIARRHHEKHRDTRLLFFARQPAPGGDVAGDAEVWSSDETPNPDGPGTRFTLHLGDQTRTVDLPLHGRYNVGNALAAAAAAHAMGVSADGIVRGIAAVAPADHRGSVRRVGAITVVDDSYNSNPHALDEALASAAELPRARAEGGRLVAILGDMLELGPDAPRFHEECGARAAELGFGPVVGVGDLARHLVDGARGAGTDAMEAVHLDDAAAAEEWALTQVRDGDLVLIKGSRGIGLDTVAEALAERHHPADGEDA
jgi:UDP-N-acetylmuramoyl-tripeptide--D-alanyl-D-alanine ligase